MSADKLNSLLNEIKQDLEQANETLSPSDARDVATDLIADNPDVKMHLTAMGESDGVTYIAQRLR